MDRSCRWKIIRWKNFDTVIAVHLRAAFILSKSVLPEMYARKSGEILNISSLSAKAAFSWGSAYAAAKAARKGVRVNAICLGPVTETRMSRELGDVLAKKIGVSPEEQLAGFLSSIFAGARADGGGDCAWGAVSVFGTIERNDGAGY